jgi:hypothetical protein
VSAPKRIGRPPIAADAHDVTTRVSGETYDEACRIALARGISLSALARESLEVVIRVYRRRGLSPQQTRHGASPFVP